MELVKVFKKQLTKSKLVPEYKKSKITYLGKDLDEEKSFQEQGVEDESLICYEEVTLIDIGGINITYEADMISYDDSHEARANMPCGHFISKDSMVYYMLS